MELSDTELIFLAVVLRVSLRYGPYVIGHPQREAVKALLDRVREEN